MMQHQKVIQVKLLGKKKKKIKISMPEINVKEDIDALVEGEELSEEFKTKASTIFEAAVHQKVMEIATEKIDETRKRVSNQSSRRDCFIP